MAGLAASSRARLAVRRGATEYQPILYDDGREYGAGARGVVCPSLPRLPLYLDKYVRTCDRVAHPPDRIRGK